MAISDPKRGQRNRAYGTPAEVLPLARALWGAALLLVPRALLDRLGPPSSDVVGVTRILGARHLLEALVLSRRRAPPRWSVMVDIAHGASMLAVAARSPRLRRDALASAAVAGLLAGWTEVERRRCSTRAQRPGGAVGEQAPRGDS